MFHLRPIFTHKFRNVSLSQFHFTINVISCVLSYKILHVTFFLVSFNCLMYMNSLVHKAVYITKRCSQELQVRSIGKAEPIQGNKSRRNRVKGRDKAFDPTSKPKTTDILRPCRAWKRMKVTRAATRRRCRREGRVRNRHRRKAPKRRHRVAGPIGSPPQCLWAYSTAWHSKSCLSITSRPTRPRLRRMTRRIKMPVPNILILGMRCHRDAVIGFYKFWQFWVLAIRSNDCFASYSLYIPLFEDMHIYYVLRGPYR